MTYSITTIKKDGGGVEYGIQWKGKFDPVATCPEWRDAQRICAALNRVTDAMAAVKHIAKRIHDDDHIRYRMGWGTESLEKIRVALNMTEKEAAIKILAPFQRGACKVCQADHVIVEMTRIHGGEHICEDCIDQALDGKAVEKASQIIQEYDPVERLPTSRCGFCLAFVPDIAMAESPDGARICTRCATEQLNNQKTKQEKTHAH